MTRIRSHGLALVAAGRCPFVVSSKGQNRVESLMDGRDEARARVYNLSGGGGKETAMNARRSVRLILWGLSAAVLLAAPTMAQPVLTLEGSCPGPMRAQAEGMFPRAVVYLYFSPERGLYEFPPFHMCYGVDVGLNVHRLHFVGSTRADDFGTAGWEGDVGPRACGGFMQAMDNRCQISNVVQVP